MARRVGIQKERLRRDYRVGKPEKRTFCIAVGLELLATKKKGGLKKKKEEPRGERLRGVRLHANGQRKRGSDAEMTERYCKSSQKRRKGGFWNQKAVIIEGGTVNVAGA